MFLQSCGAARKVRIREKNTKKVNAVQLPKQPSQAVPRSIKKTTSKTAQAEEYIARYAQVAQDEMKTYKIPASITLAQGLLESGFGTGRLAVKGNNHFGIKCHKEWEGKRIYHDDDKKGECFRVYKNASQSFRDHSLFLTNRARYASLFDLKTTNYKAWAKGLKKAGYATDPKYPEKLIRLIERFELYRYDKSSSRSRKKSDKYTAQTAQKGERSLHLVKKGDTLYSIAKKYNTSVEKLLSVNQLEVNTIYLGQEIIIPKN